MNSKGDVTGISCVNSVVKYKSISPVRICMIRQIPSRDPMFRHPLISSPCNQQSGGQRKTSSLKVENVRMIWVLAWWYMGMVEWWNG